MPAVPGPLGRGRLLGPPHTKALPAQIPLKKVERRVALSDISYSDALCRSFCVKSDLSLFVFRLAGGRGPSIAELKVLRDWIVSI